MFNLFKSKPKGTLITFKVDGMHCASCAMNIDGELEDLTGVYSAHTSFAKGEVVVDYDPDKVAKKDMITAIETAGYQGKEK